ncbi:MAG: hypothetical protein Q9169_007837 [Polycauliona sp. 2 TL-2023]
MTLRDNAVETSTKAHQKEILAWLDASNPTARYSNTIKARHTGTGSWFVHSEAFDRWTKEANSISWLWGIPGCGKTVLSATVIEELTDICSHNPDHALAYFYFAFDDQALQRVERMVRSLFAQLCTQRASIPKCVDALYSKCSQGRSQPIPPTYDMLRNTFRLLLDCFGHVFIVLDALDECTERHNLVLALEDIASWHKPSLHMLTTSRKEFELEECMRTLTREVDRVGIEGVPVEADISSYVLGRLRTDRRLRRWHKSEQEETIVSTLTSKAQGMFLWVVCQLDVLARCRSKSELQEALLSLPKGLDDTYARILKIIDDEGNHAQVFQILQLLVGSNEPVTICQAAETITIDLNKTPQVDLDRRLVDLEDAVSMWSSLITLEKREDDTDVRDRVLRLAHFSIREYLLSTRIQKSTVSHWAMDAISTHLFIARLYIAYILFVEINADECTDQKWPYSQFCQDYPLIKVATSRWFKHLSIAELSETNFAWGKIGSQLFTADTESKCSPLVDLVRKRHCDHCFDLFRDESTWHQRDEAGIRQGSLMFTAHHNLPQTTEFLLAGGANPDTIHSYYDPGDSACPTPIVEATHWGHTNVVRRLLDHHVDVEIERQDCPNALKRACRYVYTEIVRLLLDYGADPNARVAGQITALGAALEACTAESYPGTSDSVKMLLQAGADIHDPVYDGIGSAPNYSPIAFGAYRIRNISVLRMLLENGADSVDGLAASCEKQSPERVLLCLAHGADINARAPVGPQVVKYWWSQLPFAGRTALQRACAHDDPRFVRMLLDHGADPNLCSPEGGSALEAYLNRPQNHLESGIGQGGLAYRG